MSKKIGDIAYITKLAGFEHTKYIQGNSVHIKLDDSYIPLFIGKTVRNGKIDMNFDWYISKNISEKLPRSQLKKKCLVIPYVGTLGDLAIYDGSYPAHLGSNIAKIELNDNCGYSEEFVYYFLKSPYGQSLLLRDVQGAVQKNITMEAIREVELPDISIEEQNKIVYVLSTIDYKLSLNEEIISNIESLSDMIYKYWFVQFNFPNDNNVSYKNNGGNMIWNDKLGQDIPEGWEVGNLYDIANYINGLACQKYRPKQEVGLPVIKIKEMNYGITSDTERVSSKIPVKYIINDDDILFSWSATLEVKRWYGGIGGLNQHIFKVEPIKYGRNYTYIQLKNYIINFIKIASSRKTTMGHITSDHIKDSIILLPPKILVDKFENKISPLYRIILNKSQENQQLNKLKNEILPLIFNGQIKIED